MSHFVIVGAGECGARAAFALREKGFAGEITLVGDEPVAPYERPPLSKHSDEASTLPKFVVDLERYADAGIALRLGETVIELDPAGKSLTLSGGETLSFDKLLLTTGARARPFPGLTDRHGRIRALRTHADALALQALASPGKRFAVIGGGFIGLEFAASARKRGAEVTVIEGLPRVLQRGVPEEIASVIVDRHRAHGVDIRCATSIASIEETPDAVEVSLGDGSRLKVDAVLVGIGAIPNTALAEAAGLQLENGIAVNEKLETSVADIYAAGDCCSFPLPVYGGRRVRLESWRNAQEQGNLAATNMLGADEVLATVPWFWSDQYDLTLQIAGLSEGTARTLRRDLGNDAFLLFHLDADGRLIAAAGIGQGNAVARDIRLAEMLIAARAHPDPEALASSAVKLKSLLAA